ncbi:MAG: DUF481 domain-containing protein, partial [Myxococcota bacterium]
MSKLFGTITVLIIMMPALASAQKNPVFVGSEKPKEEAQAVEWKASAQAGLFVATGNTEQTVVSAGAAVSRKQGYNKLQMNGSVSYARTTLVVAEDTDDDGTSDTLNEQTQTTAQAWEVKARYDRFLTENNSLYISALVSGDEPA